MTETDRSTSGEVERSSMERRLERPNETTPKTLKQNKNIRNEKRNVPVERAGSIPKTVHKSLKKLGFKWNVPWWLTLSNF